MKIWSQTHGSIEKYIITIIYILFRWCSEGESGLFWERIENTLQHQLDHQCYAMIVHQNPPRTLHAPLLSSPVSKPSLVATKENSSFAVFDDIAIELVPCCFANPLPLPISHLSPFCNAPNLTSNIIIKFKLSRNVPILSVLILKLNPDWRWPMIMMMMMMMEQGNGAGGFKTALKP